MSTDDAKIQKAQKQRDLAQSYLNLEYERKKENDAKKQEKIKSLTTTESEETQNTRKKIRKLIEYGFNESMKKQ